MAILTQTVVLKTVTAASVKLTTPADRIGQGTAVRASNPANVLSAYPASERMSGLRLRLAEMAMPAVEPPTDRTGLSHVPGSSARRHGSRLAALPVSGWRSVSKPGVRGSDFPGCVRVSARFDGDCQSPDRHDSRANPSSARIRFSNLATREVLTATTAKK